MEELGPVRKLIEDYQNKQIDLGVQHIVSDLIEHSNEYKKDLEEEKKRARIDNLIAENFEIRGYIDEILDYLENNEDKLAYDIVYTDLNKEVREVILFISDNNDKFNDGSVYLNFFANIINKLSTERLTRLGTYREYYCKKLLSKGVNIGKESFYLKIKNDIFDLINQLNFEYIYNIQTRDNSDNKKIQKRLNESEDENKREIEMNKASLELIFELIDILYEDNDIQFGDIKRWYFRDSFEYIKEFLYVNEENIKLLMKNSIYFSHFMKIINLIDANGRETMSDIKGFLEEELSENSIDKVVINKGYYDEMKEELYELVKDLNNMLVVGKNN